MYFEKKLEVIGREICIVLEWHKVGYSDVGNESPNRDPSSDHAQQSPESSNSVSQDV